jgi:membrane-associated phospholipid phosphatase
VRLRSCEWVLIGYFVWVAAISPFFAQREPQRLYAPLVAVIVFLLLVTLARSKFSIARDWTPLALTLLAYREMDWFTPKHQDHHLELSWITWDRALLHDWGLQKAIESTGWALPGYLEFCYLLVYAVGPFTLAILYVFNRRDLVSRVLFVYLLGTLLAYAMFPFFPSGPPRTVFPNADLPVVTTAFRRLNLFLVNNYGIHSSVFPSAHVSSAFSAAWALLMFWPAKRRLGWGLAIYAISVSLATIYGRYHFLADAAAGLGVSVLAAALTYLLNRPGRSSSVTSVGSLSPSFK